MRRMIEPYLLKNMVRLESYILSHDDRANAIYTAQPARAGPIPDFSTYMYVALAAN